MKSFHSLPLLGFTTLTALTTLASGAVVQTNYGTGDGTLPGGSAIVAADNLLSTSLASASRTGADDLTPDNQYFYGEDNGGSIPVVLSRLYDGQFGAAGGVSSASVLPNQVSITFNLDLLVSPAGYDLSSIRTYAGWDSGRDGQQYTVDYATASDPGTFLPLASVTRFDNTDFPLIERDIEDEDGNPTGQTEMVPDRRKASTLVWLQAQGNRT